MFGMSNNNRKRDADEVGLDVALDILNEKLEGVTPQGLEGKMAQYAALKEAKARIADRMKDLTQKIEWEYNAERHEGMVKLGGAKAGYGLTTVVAKADSFDDVKFYRKYPEACTLGLKPGYLKTMLKDEAKAAELDKMGVGIREDRVFKLS